MGFFENLIGMSKSRLNVLFQKKVTRDELEPRAKGKEIQSKLNNRSLAPLTPSPFISWTTLQLYIFVGNCRGSRSKVFR